MFQASKGARSLADEFNINRLAQRCLIKSFSICLTLHHSICEPSFGIRYRFRVIDEFQILFQTSLSRNSLGTPQKPIFIMMFGRYDNCGKMRTVLFSPLCQVLSNFFGTITFGIQQNKNPVALIPPSCYLEISF